jgi:hypothetical protein
MNKRGANVFQGVMHIPEIALGSWLAGYLSRLLSFISLHVIIRSAYSAISFPLCHRDGQIFR